MDEFLKPTRVRSTQLDAWPVVSSVLFEFTPASDDIISIVSRAGLDVDWNLSPKEAFSHSTRKRAYRPRVHAAYSALSDEDRAIVLSLIIAELARRFPAHTEAIKISLARIGWALNAVTDRKQHAGLPRLHMKRIKELQRLLLLHVRDGEVLPELSQYTEEDRVYNSALLINDGYVDGQAIQNGNGVYVSTVMTQLTSKGHDFLEETDMTTRPSTVTAVGKSSKRIFVSHSSTDQDLAEALLDLLCAALPLRRNDFICTSVDGAKLRGGDDTDEVLRNEISDVPVFLSLLTKGAMASTYVLFELGARWGCKKDHIPLLSKGAGVEVLKEPLKATNSLQMSNEADVLQLVQDVADILKLKAEPPNSYLKKAHQVTQISRAGLDPASQQVSRLRFVARDAELHGAVIKYEHDEVMDNIGYWNSAGDFVTWKFEIVRPASFSAVIEQACAKGCGGTYALTIGTERIESNVIETGTWQNFTRSQLGRINITKPGKYEMKVEPITLKGGALMNLKAIDLFPSTRVIRAV